MMMNRTDDYYSGIGSLQENGLNNLAKATL